MLSKSITLKHYKRKEIQDVLVDHAKDKEIGMRYHEAFGKRPDVLTYPRDILELALQGVTSFHASEERWSNPLTINSSLSKKELEALRIGWDLVLDIDCALFEYSRICADLVIQFLSHCGVKDLSCKFSGNKGFHIGVPFEAFPQKIGSQLTKDLFPEAPKRIAFYVKENIKGALGKKILEYENNNFSAIREKVQLPQEDIIRYDDDEFGGKIPRLNVDTFLEIDTVLISSRHLYRMPYSLHEKSGLASLPIDPEKVSSFEKDLAQPEKILDTMFPFLDRNVTGESARQLLVQAYDFDVKLENEKEAPSGKYEELKIETAIKEELFPPCIKLLLNGMEDGKKRSVFMLSNFLGKIGWEKQEIENYLKEWNQKNTPPLRDVYIKGQMHGFTPGSKLPPNCNNDAYYKGVGVCHPDSLCARIKNPVNYTLIRWKRQLRDREDEKTEKGESF
ncbi:MAG: hypothetical protein Q8R37_02535 [Nanoarchaeota archaeon]|nr:hypothetical protein [Nanoarchaeota archaeon]